MNEELKLSKRDLIFLAHVLSGAIQLKPVKADRCEETGQVSISDRLDLQALQDNCEQLSSLLDLIDRFDDEAYVHEGLEKPKERV